MLSLQAPRKKKENSAQKMQNKRRRLGRGKAARETTTSSYIWEHRHMYRSTRKVFEKKGYHKMRGKEVERL